MSILKSVSFFVPTITGMERYRNNTPMWIQKQKYIYFNHFKLALKNKIRAWAFVCVGSVSFFVQVYGIAKAHEAGKMQANCTCNDFWIIWEVSQTNAICVCLKVCQHRPQIILVIDIQYWLFLQPTLKPNLLERCSLALTIITNRAMVT